MNIDAIVKELWAQQRRVNAALIALVGTSVESEPVTEVQPTVAVAKPVAVMPNHRTMSFSVRRKISTSMKRKWAEKSKPKRTLSPAVKAKISASQRERWATIKASALQATSHAAVAHPRGNHDSALAVA